MSDLAERNRKTIAQVLGNLTFVYLFYKGSMYVGRHLICNNYRTQLLEYANGDTLLTDSFNKMSCAEISTSHLYVFDYLHYDLKPNANSGIVDKIEIIKHKYGIF